MSRRGMWRAAAATWVTLACAVAAAQAPPAGLTGAWRLVSTTSVPASAKSGPGAGPPPVIAAMLTLVRPEAAARIAAASRAAAAPGAPPQDRGYCAPPALVGPAGFFLAPPAGIPTNIEILPGPRRLTLVDESGLVRRLFLRDTPPKDAMDESNAGTSLAHMEGKTLVVRTTGLNSAARAVLGVAGTELGQNATLLERFTLVAPDTLEIVTTTTAPELYRAPQTSTARFQRDDERTPLELSICFDNDRSYTRSTGTERFDATPPADLPPPPTN